MSATDEPTHSDPPSRLTRSLGLGGAAVVGVSAMVGTGVFAVWQPALDRAGTWLIAAVVIAGLVASLNATSTARLAARFPRAGGVYAYGRAQLNRPAGVLAGVVFIIGKTASASAAALTIGLYVWPENAKTVAFVTIALVLALNLRGVVRSTRVAAVMVTIVIAILLLFTGLVGAQVLSQPDVTLPQIDTNPVSVLAASALIFVAFAGYARITVLGEEVRNPARVIPRAVAISFAIVLALYVLIAVIVTAAVGRGITVGPAALADIAESEVGSWLRSGLVVAAVLAAGAVLLSLIAGVGRTLFAMADAGDGPRFFAAVGESTKVPYRAEIAAALGSAILVLLGGLVLALGVSAAMILTYYAISHLAAMRLDRRRGLAGVLVGATPFVGLAGCALLVGALLVG
ncbi:MAG: APC family permease [Actinomycetota bacterium]|nr:APC family permease [Actinomycetota bacterium]